MSAAAANVEHIHDRMPVILKGDALTAWMDRETGKADALELLRENRGEDLEFHAVSKEVGKVASKGPELIDPIDI